MEKIVDFIVLIAAIWCSWFCIGYSIEVWIKIARGGEEKYEDGANIMKLAFFAALFWSMYFF